jgi:hypothetical protein
VGAACRLEGSAESSAGGCPRLPLPHPVQARIFDLAAVRQHAAAPRALQLISPEQLLTYPVPSNENCAVAANQAQPTQQAAAAAAAAAAAGPGPEEAAAAGWAPATGISLPAARPRPGAAAAAGGRARGLAVRPSGQKSQLAFNRKQLRLLLQQHGEYPAEYRLLIWWVGGAAGASAEAHGVRDTARLLAGMRQHPSIDESRHLSALEPKGGPLRAPTRPPARPAQGLPAAAAAQQHGARSACQPRRPLGLRPPAAAAAAAERRAGAAPAAHPLRPGQLVRGSGPPPPVLRDGPLGGQLAACGTGR